MGGALRRTRRWIATRPQAWKVWLGLWRGAGGCRAPMVHSRMDATAGQSAFDGVALREQVEDVRPDLRPVIVPVAIHLPRPPGETVAVGFAPGADGIVGCAY